MYYFCNVKSLCTLCLQISSQPSAPKNPKTTQSLYLKKE
jgi:hypothetical protein